jgi:PAS domain S-box-containing protein
MKDSSRKKPEKGPPRAGDAPQAMLQAIMDNSTAIIFIKDKSGRYAFVNRRFEEVFQTPRGGLIGKTVYDVFPRDIADKLNENDKKVAESALSIEGEDRILHPDGQLRTYLAIKFPIPGMPGAVGCITNDITERKRMEEELFKARKLESLGDLAGGIAHDFNNLLLGILGNVSMAKTMVRPDDKVFDMLDQVEKAASRAKGLTKQILTFSRGGEPIREAADLGGLLRNSAAVVLKGSNARCEFDLPEDLWTADVDEGQISHVFNNILLNAMQSMPGGGVISIGTANCSVACDSPLPLKKGDYVMVAIRDTGCGIPEKDLGRIFDPFFTTRQKASGLGLALSYSIVRKHGGHICAESKPGKGSVFYVYLPAARKEDSAERPGGPEKDVTGKLRILVMDDEDLVRDVMAAMLGNLGFEADFALNGAEAIDIFRTALEAGRPFDAVILDLTVPGGMGGKETMQKLLEIDPRVRGIVSSGYSKDPIMSDFRKYGFRAVMAKPFRASDFGRVIKNVLAEGR